MGMSKDLSRQAEKKSRQWQRTEKEKSYQRETISDHSKEYAADMNTRQEKARQTEKINQIRHQ